MDKVWVYTIVFYRESDEYPYDIYHGVETQVFPTKESAEKWKDDYEKRENIEYIQNRNEWYGSFRSSIEEKEILKY